jgi:hypothetical protein
MIKLKRKSEILMWEYDHGYFNIQSDERKKNIMKLVKEIKITNKH